MNLANLGFTLKITGLLDLYKKQGLPLMVKVEQAVFYKTFTI